MNTLGDIILVGALLVLCVPPVLGMRALCIHARKALLGRDK